MICNNGSYHIADYSENSFENWILHYRKTTDHLARKTSIDDNHTDCLKNLYTASRQNIRQNTIETKKKVKDNYITDSINSFFSVSEDGNKWSFQ